jgi:hypothetical protein
MSVHHEASSWDTSGLVQALQVASLQQATNHGDWYMDSHMTRDQGNLTTYFSSLVHDSSQVVVVNDSHLPILGTGSTHIRAPHINFLLSSVLHIPTLVSNLIFVCKFTRNNWCFIEFDPFDFSVKDLITKTQILGSNSSGDLYPFVGFSKMNNNFTISTTILSVDLKLAQKVGAS